MRPYKYTYRIIAGAGVFAEYKSLSRAIANLPAIQKIWNEHFPGQVEIERQRQFLDSGGLQYEVKRNGKWVNSWDGLYGDLKHETKGPW